jgi:beta-galactosidase
MRNGTRLLLVVSSLLTAAGRSAAADYVWIEGEAPASASVNPKTDGWGNKHFLSGESWLHYQIDANKVEKETPVDGITLKYTFRAPKEAKYEVWNRIGFEFVRSPFRWRVDGGAWATVRPEELTTDLMELATWNEVAWLKMGERPLTAGEHTLEINLPRTKEKDGKTARIVYASDALLLYPGTFHPDGKNRPGEDARDARDREAAEKVFKLPESAGGGARAAVALGGLWEVCRHDEQTPGETAAPIKDFPVEPHWKAIPVPGDRNTLRPDLVFAHRLWYRTRVFVPPSHAGRSFHLVFPQNNLNTTVFVNKVFCGFNKNPFARFTIDVTPGVRPGEVNEVWVGIKDAWYGYSTNPRDPMKLRKRFNLPLDFSHQGFQDLAYPVWGHFESGILVTPGFIAAGPVAAADVFVKPSVAKKELAVEILVANRTGAGAAARVTCEAVNRQTGQVEMRTGSLHDVDVPAGGEKRLEIVSGWKDPKLWWPDDPQMYLLRTTVSVGGKPVDVQETPFGFREWSADGKDFKLNGVVWHGWCDQHTHDTREEWLAFHRKTHQTTMRFWGVSWQGLPPEQALDFFDRNGVVVRRSGILDGEAIGYMAVENDPDLQKESPIKMDLMRNWRDQVVAQVKGERNHPSVNVWSIENEWLYINCINLYGGLMDRFEAEVKQTSDAVRAADPTRLTMTDGGGANKDQSMPVHGNHYVNLDPHEMHKFPAHAYAENPEGGGRRRWVWDQKRPRYLGEDFFANGVDPADFAYFGGEETVQGKAQSRPAVALICRMLTEGYRWAGFGAWDLWLGQSDAADYYIANSPRAVFCRQWDWTFAPGQKVRRTFGVFNDTHSDEPITFTWKVSIGGAERSAATEHRIPPGGSEKFDVTLEMPAIHSRAEGQLVLTLSVGGKEVFRDVKAVSVLAPGAAQAHAAFTEKTLAVCDPAWTAVAFLKARGIPFTPLADLKQLPKEARVLLVGRDALDATESTSSRLAACAAEGHRVIVLEQKNPLRYQGLPAEMEPAVNEGSTAFAEDLEHPALRGLKQKDFFTWGPDEVVYRNTYQKPTRGGRSLVQCHERLRHTALAEVPVDSGLLLLCQLAVGERLESNAVAQQLLLNLLDYADAYKLEHRPVVAALGGGDPQMAKALDEIGLRYTRANDPVLAVARPGRRIALVAATPANLKALADNLPKVKAFTDAGGWVVLHGLTPEGLADYNKLVGFDHMIRPFRRERVTLPAARSPLLSGVTTGDVALYSAERIFPWAEGNYVASDIFSYVVDLDDVAPFAKFPGDHLLNMVNGFVSADAWKLIVNVPAPPKPPLDWTLRLPKEQEIVGMDWIGNTFYYPVTKVELIFDGKERAAFATKPINDVQTFALDPPRRGREITLRLADWRVVPGKAAVTGLDNLRLFAKRPPDFHKTVRPLLNIGAMVEYPRGPGGLLLCNLRFLEREEVPGNYARKRMVFAALLRNLQAPFASGKTILAGGRLRYFPVDLSGHATQYRDETGWFGDRKFTFKELPTGKQTFAGVRYDVYEFATSPVPTAVMLAGPGVPNKLPEEVRGIPVGRKADALFFLHAARIDQRRSEQEVKDRKRFELARYVVHYEDGKTADIPVYSEIDVDDYRQRTPAPLPGAQIAWTRPWPGTGFTAVAYAKQWNNPRSDVPIKSVDMVYGKDRRGVPVLLALTAAQMER